MKTRLAIHPAMANLLHHKRVLLLALVLGCSGAARAADTGGYSTATGGGDAKPVYADSMFALQSAATWGNKVIIYTGNEDAAIKSAEENVCGQWSKSPREILIGSSNLTIIGAPGSSANFGIRLKGARNVIIQGMSIGMMQGGARNGDIIGIQAGSRDIWLHHNNFFNKHVDCPDTPDGDTTFDGMIDIRDDVDNITVSYNLLHDHLKVGLAGSSDHDNATRHLTFHHNIYSNVRARLPLQRFGFVHAYNNIYDGVEVSGINVRQEGQALIEGNWFENARNPVTSRDSPVAGYWDLRNNNISSPADFEKYNITWDVSRSTLKNASDWITTKPFPAAALTYAYTADSAQCVHEHLAEFAGPSKGDKRLICPPASVQKSAP
jgi:pectate lyase